MKNIEQTTNAINNTIAARKSQLPLIQSQRDKASNKIASLKNLQGQIDTLLDLNIDNSVRAEILDARNALATLSGELNHHMSSLSELEAEFSRDTLNIGVSGAARTGKSTTLQHITGLTDKQIPSGGLNPVTAVRSEIYNSLRNEAVITFRTERSFIEGYILPHVHNINKYLDVSNKISVESLSDLKSAKLPERLDGAVIAAASDSLKRLREAKRSASSFECLLGSADKTVSIDDVREYVTYPSPEEEERENDSNPADRRYLAVELAQIFCQFPNLGEAKVGLVDLPGLGEIGNSASSIHLKGLEDKVDQIFLVTRPTAAKAYADAEIGFNLDQLQTIQPAVRRGDLILVGINVDKQAGQGAANNLRNNFNSEINNGRSDRYKIVDYSAVDDSGVARIFNELLNRLETQLPHMDQQKIEYCTNAVDIFGKISSATERVVRAMDRIMQTIPSSDRVMKQRIDEINRTIIGKLKCYENELLGAAEDSSDVFKSFIAEAESVHNDVAKRIANGLFRASSEEWLELTSSSKDFYNLYRDEDKRIRYEIIDAYCNLDRFYGQHVSNFKLRVLNIILHSCNMNRYFNFKATDSADERIKRVASELSSTLRDKDLDSAFRLLEKMNFDFRSNVFLQIEKSLAELANPAECYHNNSRRPVSKRETLGGEGSPEKKQSQMLAYLQCDANKANDGILTTLKREKDYFGKYLAVSIDFFNNYLFGKDEDNFKQVVIRGLINEYKQYVLPDADDASKSPLGQIANAIKESAFALQGEHRNSFQKSVTGPERSSLQKSANHTNVKTKKGASFSEGEIVSGTIVDITEKGARINGSNYRGFIPKGQISSQWVEDVSNYVKKGQKVRAKIIKINPKNSWLTLSIKQAQQESR